MLIYQMLMKKAFYLPTNSAVRFYEIIGRVEKTLKRK